MGLNAVAGCPPEEYGLNPLRYDQMRPGCYDIHERIRDMNANGVLGSINFPTFVHFCGQLFLRAEDKELALACVPDDEVNKITHLNAMKLYSFDPFKTRPREKCTVGALKAEGADVDISIQSMGRPKGTPFTARQLAELARPK